MEAVFLVSLVLLLCALKGLYSRGYRRFADRERAHRRRHGVGNSILDRKGRDYE